MPTESYFSRFPTFPEDLATVALPKISLDTIRSGDSKESGRLFHACRQYGFFLLDLSSCDAGRRLLSEAEEVFMLNERVHALPSDQLERYAYERPEDLMGRDDILRVDHASSARPHPAIITSALPQLVSFFKHVDAALKTIFCVLETHLRLDSGTLTSLNDPCKPSGTVIRLIRSLTSAEAGPRANMIGHTDLGTITMLFNAVGGLQFLPAGRDSLEDENWEYVRPHPGCAIINLGDAMVEWSGGVLRSNMHRIVTPPGAQKTAERYSVAVQIRPEKRAIMKTLKSSVIPSESDASGEAASENKDGCGRTNNVVEMCAKEWEIHRQAGYLSGVNRAKTIGGTHELLHTDLPLEPRIC